MEALQQCTSANGSLAPNCVRAACSKPPSSRFPHVRRMMRGTDPLFSSNLGLKAKVQEQVGMAGDGKGASRGARVVAMAKSVAPRYAAALAEVGQAQNNLDSIFADVEKLGHFAEDDQFWKFFTNPVVRCEDKRSVLKNLGKEANFVPATLNLLYVLVDKRRTRILKEFVKEFEVIYNKHTDTQVALVTSAVEMDKSQLAFIGKKVQSMTGSKNVRLKNIIDPSVIAGFIVRFDDRLVDMSVKGQLHQIALQIELAEESAAF